MKLKHLVIGAASAAFLVGQAQAAVLVNYDTANVGNGQLIVGGTVNSVAYSQGALLNETLPGNIFFNGDGRALAQYGSDGYNGGGVGGPADVSSILNNAAVDIDGFTIYRGLYSGGNNSFGTLETGTRLGASGNTAFNGHAFANAGEFFMLSDVFNVPFGTADLITVSFQAGSDNGSVDLFSAYLVLDGANVATQLGVTQAGNSAGAPRLTFSGSGLSAASTVQLFIETSTSDNTRALVDNVYFEIVPEPTTFALAGLGLAGLLIFRRRS